MTAANGGKRAIQSNREWERESSASLQIASQIKHGLYIKRNLLRRPGSRLSTVHSAGSSLDLEDSYSMIFSTTLFQPATRSTRSPPDLDERRAILVTRGATPFAGEAFQTSTFATRRALATFDITTHVTRARVSAETQSRMENWTPANARLSENRATGLSARETAICKRFQEISVSLWGGCNFFRVKLRVDGSRMRMWRRVFRFVIRM